MIAGRKILSFVVRFWVDKIMNCISFSRVNGWDVMALFLINEHQEKL